MKKGTDVSDRRVRVREGVEPMTMWPISTKWNRPENDDPFKERR